MQILSLVMFLSLSFLQCTNAAAISPLSGNPDFQIDRRTLFPRKGGGGHIGGGSIGGSSGGNSGPVYKTGPQATEGPTEILYAGAAWNLNNHANYTAGDRK
jgi:hypothetical protein